MHPELLEVLVAPSPHFTRLRNPILRRLHGKLVTLAQAAAIAGLDPAALVRSLNAAVGQVAADEAPVGLRSLAGTPAPAWFGVAPVAQTLDIRDDQARGAEPFHRIMAAVEGVGSGQVLCLRDTFEPLPLYDVLDKRGFVPWARRLGDEAWEVYFYRAAAPIDREDQLAETAPEADLSGQAPAATLSIDVRELVPPQPMLRILDALQGRPAGEVLLVHHKRQPVFLYPKLAELGYTHETLERGPDAVDIYIRKP